MEGKKWHLNQCDASRRRKVKIFNLNLLAKRILESFETNNLMLIELKRVTTLISHRCFCRDKIEEEERRERVLFTDIYQTHPKSREIFGARNAEEA